MRRDWIVASLATAVVALSGGEIAARLLSEGDDRYVPPVAADDRLRPHDEATLFRPNARFLWLGQPGRLREYANFVRINALGFHDVEHPVAKPPGIRRVLVVGDSYVEAFQVPLRAGLPRLLAARLAAAGTPAEVVAVARSGWGPIEYRAAIEEWAPKLGADAVVLVLYLGNDVRNASSEAEKVFGEQLSGPFGGLWTRPPDRELPGVVLPGSRLNVVLARSARIRRVHAAIDAWDFPWKLPADMYTFVGEEIPFVEEGWRRIALEVGAAAAEMRREGRALLVVSTSMALRMQGAESLRASLERDYPEARRRRWDFDSFEKRLGPIVRDAGVPWIDLQARLAARMRREGVNPHFPSDTHWNETGHRWAADEIAPEIAAALAR